MSTSIQCHYKRHYELNFTEELDEGFKGTRVLAGAVRELPASDVNSCSFACYEVSTMFSMNR